MAYMLLSVVVEDYPMTRTLAFLLTASLAACHSEADVHYSGEATTPDMVVMDSDASVQVVANADEPIFYTDNSYYLYRDNHWYRSRSHRSGWARVDDPPEHIRRIDRPLAYVHFRGAGDRTTFNQSNRAQSPEPVLPAPQPAPLANPMPPQQVPPISDPHAPMRPDQVPPVTPDRDRPNQQIAPDPSSTSPSPDQRPVKRGDDQSPSPNDHTKRTPDPDRTNADRDLRPDGQPAQPAKPRRGDDTSPTPTGKKGTPPIDKDKKSNRDKQPDDKDKDKN